MEEKVIEKTTESINKIIDDGLNTNNVKDMSFMFANSKAQILDLTNLNTSQYIYIKVLILMI